MSFSSDMKMVATELLETFGNNGKLLLNDEQTDRVTGEKTGVSSEINIVYTPLYTDSTATPEERVSGGEAFITFVCDLVPDISWSFVDYSGNVWGIESVMPIETQDSEVAYEARISK